MSLYATRIREATGCDPETAALIEDVMRTARTALDHLTTADITREAREVYAELLLNPDVAKSICVTSQITVPAWATV